MTIDELISTLKEADEKAPYYVPEYDSAIRESIEMLEELKTLRAEKEKINEQIENLSNILRNEIKQKDKTYIRAIDECIKITEETVWKDADMLVRYFENYKRLYNGEDVKG